MAEPWKKYEQGPWSKYETEQPNYPTDPSDNVTGNQSTEIPLSTVTDPRNAIAKTLMPRDPGVDYKTGVSNMSFRADLSRMDTAEEKEAYLTKRVGEGWARDSKGRYLLKPEGAEALGVKHRGMPLAIDEQGLSTGDVADLRGDVPAIAGGVAAAFASGGSSIPVQLAAIILGGATGKLVGEVEDSARGENLQPFLPQTELGGKTVISMGEDSIAGDVAAEGLLAGAGELAAGPGRFAIKGFSDTLDPARKAAFDQARAIGAVPDVGKATGSPYLQRLVNFRKMLSGDRYEYTNAKAFHNEIAALKRDAGPSASLEPLTRDMREQVVARREAARDRLSEIGAQVRKDKDEMLAGLEKKIGREGEINVKDDLSAARSQLADQSRVMYSRVDAVLGDSPVVPTNRLKAQAEEIASRFIRPGSGNAEADELLRELILNPEKYNKGEETLQALLTQTTAEGKPLFQNPQTLALLAQIKQMPDEITLGQAQELRTMLREAAFDDSLLPGIGKRRSRQMFQAMDESMSVDLPEGAAQLLKEADAFYRDGIGKFDDLTIQALAKENVNPDRVAAYVTQYPARAAKVKGLVSEGTWGAVQKQHFYDMAERSTVAGSKGEGELLDGRRLYDLIRNDKSLDVVYGKQADEIRKAARQLYEMDARVISPDLSGDVAKNLKQLVKAEQDYQKYMETNFLKELGKDGVEFERAVGYIVKPKSAVQIRQAKEFFGPDSETWLKIRRQAANDVLSTVVEPGKDGIKAAFSGDKLYKALERYGAETLEETFGSDWTQRAYRLANTIKYITHEGNKAGQIAAANIALKPLQNLARGTSIKVMGRLLDNPLMSRYLMQGILSGHQNPRQALLIANRLNAFIGTMSDEYNPTAGINPMDELEQE